MEALASSGLLVLRLAVAGLMLPHGISKIMMVFDGKASAFLNPIGIGAAPSIWLAIFAELVCSALIACGFLTRAAAFVLAVNMCVISFYWIRQSSGWNASLELPLLYLAVYVTLVCTGSGKFGLDSLY